MPRPPAGDKNPPLDDRAGETAPRREHGGAWLPGEVVEVEAEGGGGGRGAVDGEGARVEEGAPEDVEVGPQRHRSEVAEAVDLGVAGHGRERAPGERVGVEEERRSDRWVLREDAEKMVPLIQRG